MTNDGQHERRDTNWIERRIERLEDRIDQKLDALPDRLAVATATALHPVTEQLKALDLFVARQQDRIAALELWRASTTGSTSTWQWVARSVSAVGCVVLAALLGHYLS